MKIRACTVLLVTTLVVATATSAFAEGTPVRPGVANASDFPASTACACHSARVEEWSPSMHAQSITDPVFQAKVAEAQAAAGEEVAVFCKRCHSPIGNMTGDPNAKASAVAAEGVTCMYCHQVVGIDGKPGNTSHRLVVDQTRHAQLKDAAAPHPTAFSELHTKAEFCGGCHDVDHPGNGTHLETSYTEWAASPYAKEGIVCQDCHMSSAPGVVGPSSGTACAGGQQRDNIYAMSFVGANVGQGPADASRALLQSAATVKLQVPEIVSEGTSASVSVTVTNKGAGHYLPTGLTEVREMWLVTYAESADGSRTPIGERRFGTVMKGADGTYPVEMWDAVGIQSDERIPPRASVTSTYTLEMPKGAGEAKVVAALNYRSLPDALAVKSGVQNPTTEMASSSKAVFSSEAAKAAAAQRAEIDGGEQPGTNWLLVGGAVVLLAGVGIGIAILVRRRSA